MLIVLGKFFSVSSAGLLNLWCALMWFGLLEVHGQTDTIHISSFEYLVTDSLSTNTLQGKVALGRAEDIGDRMYFKNGIAVDCKKSFNFGFLYLQYDSLGRIRHHQFWHQELQTKLAIKLTDSGRVFWTETLTPFPTSYLLQHNGAFEQITISIKDSFNFLKRYIGNKRKDAHTMWQYRITFLRSGMPEQFGFISPNNERIGEWYIYNPLCNCYQNKEYFIP